MIVEIGGIDHHDQRVGQPLARLGAGQHVAGDLLVGGGGVEAVRAGQVNQLDRAPVVEREAPRMAFDRDAGIIADLLARAGQRVEQRTFAGVRIADQRDQRQRRHYPSDTVIVAATVRRSATVIRPMRQAIGPRPSDARWSTSTPTPSSNPNSRRRRASGTASRSQAIAAIVAG